MTSLAFTLGVVPLAVATGAGAEMRQSLGTAVFFGMLGVTLFGLSGVIHRSLACALYAVGRAQ
jgi:hydrophobic/amphiphilic exporter-1 (mainly G- bacteria), HAE1 family